MNHQHTHLRRGEQLIDLLDVPEALADLDDLNLNGCGLETLPDGVARLKQIRTLSLYDNALSQLPEAVGNSISLSH